MTFPKTLAAGLFAAAIINLGALGSGGSAVAAPISGSLSLADGANETGQSLLTRTSFSVPNALTQAGNSGDFASIPFGQVVSMPGFTVPLAVGATEAVNYGFQFQGGSFLARSSTKTDQSVTASGNESITAVFLGTFTPAGSLSGFDASGASLITNLNRSFAGAGASIASAFTLATQTTPVPEPASLALVGLGLLGLGAARRRA